MFTEQLSQALSVQAVIAPVSLNGASSTSGEIDMSKFKRIMAVISTGVMSGSITAKFQESATSGGSLTDVSGTTITAITTAAKQATIELRADQLGSGKRYVKLVVTEGGSAASLVTAVVLGGESNYKPASQFDPAAVVQRLVL